MVTLSEEWIAISEAKNGQEYIDELATLLKTRDVNTILECGCGGGHILHGLGTKGFSGLGIDVDAYMITYANKNYPQANIVYALMDWIALKEINHQYDAVMCRGNSLVVGSSWLQKRDDFDAELARETIKKSLRLMYDKLMPGGLLYLDTISQAEIDKNGGRASVKLGSLDLEGTIEYDWDNRVRYMSGGGTVNGQSFEGESTSYLITPQEMLLLVKELDPVAAWMPTMQFEPEYSVICAEK